MTDFCTLDDVGEVTGKRALVRVDLNVPMEDGHVTDDTRMRATLPTVTELADKGAIVLLLAQEREETLERLGKGEEVLLTDFAAPENVDSVEGV